MLILFVIFRACFEQEVPWHLGNQSVDSLWTRAWYDKKHTVWYIIGSHTKKKWELQTICFFQLDHSHKKQHSLETSTRLLFMLLQDFFASARLQSAQNLFLPKSAVHYLCYLKSSKTIGQRKTTKTEKYFHPWLTSFDLKLSCT